MVNPHIDNTSWQSSQHQQTNLPAAQAAVAASQAASTQGSNYNPGDGERGQNPNPVVIPKASVPTPTGMTPQQQAAITLRQAGAVTSGAFSGTALWDKSPVLYAKKLMEGPAGKYESKYFDPDSERIGQVNLRGSTVPHPDEGKGDPKYHNLEPFYSTLHEGAFSTGNASWKARMKVLSEGGTEEEAQAAADKVNKELRDAVYVNGDPSKGDRRDKGDYSGIKDIMEGKNTIINSLVGEGGTGWYTGSIADEYGFQGGYLGRDPSGRMIDIPDPTPGILTNLSTAGGGGGGGYGYGYGYGGGGGSGGYGYGYGEDEDPFPRGYQRGKVGPGGLLEAVNQLYFRLSGMNKKRGGIVSLLELT